MAEALTGRALIEARFSLFLGTDLGIESWLNGDTDERVFARLTTLATDPLQRSQLNQLLLLGHEGALSDGFFKYYWLHIPLPHEHPYSVEKLDGYSAEYKDRNAIYSLEHLRWGLYRLYTDALLYFGNIRQTYRTLRSLSFDQLRAIFRSKCFDYDSLSGLLNRGPSLALEDIPRDDRYLISEMACKSFDPGSAETTTLLTNLESAFRSRTSRGKRRSFSVKELLDGTTDIHRQGEFEFSASEFMDERVTSLPELRKKYAKYKDRFDKARSQALRNTQLYLSAVNDLDVYVATSMRSREDFRKMAANCEAVFGSDLLKGLHLRYFDPTLSAAPGHEDKGLIECLMVKCAKILIYIAGDKDSYGKDAEAAMALSMGKPVIFYCDEEKRSRFYKDVHPLSRLIDFSSGVAVGALVTSRLEQATLLIHRILSNSMEYELVKPKENYFQLRDKLTGSIIRIQTNNRLLRETFWNHYHNPV